jgi:hypothetical protein
MFRILRVPRLASRLVNHDDHMKIRGGHSISTSTIIEKLWIAVNFPKALSTYFKEHGVNVFEENTKDAVVYNPVKFLCEKKKKDAPKSKDNTLTCNVTFSKNNKEELSTQVALWVRDEEADSLVPWNWDETQEPFVTFPCTSGDELKINFVLNSKSNKLYDYKRKSTPSWVSVAAGNDASFTKSMSGTKKNDKCASITLPFKQYVSELNFLGFSVNGALYMIALALPIDSNQK